MDAEAKLAIASVAADVDRWPHIGLLSEVEQKLVHLPRVNTVQDGLLNKRIKLAQAVASGSYKPAKKKYEPDAIVRCHHVAKARLEEYCRRMEVGEVVPSSKEPQMVVLRSTGGPTNLFRHLCSHESVRRVVVALYTITGNSGSLAAISKLNYSGVERLRVAAYPKALIPDILTVIPEEVTLSPKLPTHVLTVLFAYQRYHFSLVPAAEFFHAHRNREDSQTIPWRTLVSKAYNKLYEVVELYGLIALPDSSHPDLLAFSRAFKPLITSVATKRDVWAVDMGASPGGWSAVLSERGVNVIAVDPGKVVIPTDLPGLKGRVVHVASRIEDARDAIRREISPAGDSGNSPAVEQKSPDTALLDMIVCDMNQHPYRSVEQVLLCAPMLKEGGVLVLTVKMVVPGQEKGEIICECVAEQLACCFDHVHLVYLLNNTNHERTYLAVKKRLADCTAPPSQEMLERHKARLEDKRRELKEELLQNTARKKRKKALARAKAQTLEQPGAGDTSPAMADQAVAAGQSTEI